MTHHPVVGAVPKYVSGYFLGRQAEKLGKIVNIIKDIVLFDFSLEAR
jgi:hypothetical protein